MTVRILVGDCRDRLKEIPDNYFHTAVTSPPYFGLRDYGVDGQIGLEPSADDFVQAMVEVFRSVRRTLREDGTLWLNLGDSYNRKTKQLQGIPWRTALALQADGWVLRSDVIWSKLNPLPDGANDRPTKSHEYLFLLGKSSDYFYDAEAVREERVSHVKPKRRTDSRNDGKPGIGSNDTDSSGALSDSQERRVGRNRRTVWTLASEPYRGGHFAAYPTGLVLPCIMAGTSEYGCCAKCGRPYKRIVERYNPDAGDKPQAHQIDLRGSAVKNNNGQGKSTLGTVTEYRTVGWQSGCAHTESGRVPCRVLDPFSGAGTTALVAERIGRDSVGTELNRHYAEISQERILTDEKLDHWPTVSVE